ncbi:NahK/ErcS family hybrid sensor histidine kinase/response regulator [Aliikangiella coralliicola]|uniref:histidine kinase n=1 Tax=Aliikangiella coralliicola TaxID=2592383 RepID=A0A545UCW3_9GAMM|nr:NahK/ErcS family hybrid sensor histidine kinase/response regulator [Aliikangiella coralliicola]TQV87301.1 PAS domain S-box protein [Aliikangiella coralliicola]
MISTLQIIVIAFAYVCLLFLIAYTSDKNKPRQISSKRKALVYSFSLAIYCTSWTFYGAVGSAAKTGWGYLPIYLGPILVYTLGWPLLERFVRVGHEQNTTSISDFIASRFGKSQSIAAIVTVIAIIAILPYIALQLKAITMSIQVFDAQQDLFSNHHFNALLITFLLIIFSILFGTRNLDVTEHQYGMMNAIAFESIVKLIAFCAVGLFALFSIFDGPTSLLNAITNDVQLSQLWLNGIDTENFLTQMLLASAAIFCLPRQFHVSVVEYHQPDDLRYARWIFPTYLLLISLFVIPIVVAGSQYFSSAAYVNSPVNADTFILALPLAEKQSLLSAIVFIGGLSAATGMVIVATVALSTMISNDLVLPVILKNTNSHHFKDKQFSQKMLRIRRVAIASCLILSYGFYRLLDKSQSLASIGYLSFTAVLQFMPALLCALFWSKATKLGAIAGLLSGTACWFVLTWLPSIRGEYLLSSETSFSGFSILTESLVISLTCNFFALIMVSRFSRQSLTEKIQAYAYVYGSRKEINLKSSPRKSPQVLVKDLKSLSAAIVGNERMVTSFETFSDQYDDNDIADETLLKHTENILSASIGASSARVVILSAFKDKGINVEDVINLLSSTSQALRFNRRLVEVTMDNITQGISVSDADKNIIGWNHSYEKLMNYPKDFLKVGLPIAEIIRFNAERGFCGEGDVQQHIDKRLAHIDSGLSYRFERVRNDGIVLDIVGNPLPQGGYVTTYTDVSDYKKIESALKENERQISIYTDNSPALLAYFDSELIFRFANKAFANSLYLQKEDILGKPIGDVLSPAEIGYKRQYIEKALSNQKQHFEYANQENDRYYLVTYIPNLDAAGKVVGIYTISQDISHRRKAELALKEINITLEQRVAMRTEELHTTVKALESAKAEAEQANQSKSKFLAAASHDLLQPFNAARLFSEMLKAESNTMTGSQAELVDKTDQSLTVAENIIRSLVDISKLDSGTVYPSVRVFNIFDTLDSLEKQFSGFAQNKNLKFKSLKRNFQVESDPELLYRVLQNFVSNAIRYTHNGGVFISCQKRSEYIRVSVWDTGIGIKADDQEEIFSEFKQLSDPAISATESGLGLGLAISERISAILNHPITLRSEYGRGTVFHLLIKSAGLEIQHSPEKIKRTPRQNSALADVKVLCVDNEIQITDAMSMLLERWGCDVKANQAETQIDELLNSGFIPDILIVDYQLDQGKTGLDYIQKIRHKTGLEIPAVIVTADYSQTVENKIQEFGLKLLHKPVKPAVLRATMNNELR